MKKYNTVDLIKFIMSILVVAIHTNPTINMSKNLFIMSFEAMLNIAVPFFFIESGFLLGKGLNGWFEDEQAIEYIRHYRLRMIKMYVVWTIIYLPLTIIHYVLEGNSFIRSILLFFDGFFLLGQNYNSWILWYLLSTIYAISFVLFFLKRKINIKTITIIGFLVILVGYCIDQFVAMDNLPTTLERGRYLIRYSIVNGRIFRGFFYLPCGMLLSVLEQKINKIISIIICILSFISMLFAEGFTKSILITVCSVSFVTIVNSIEIKDSFLFPIFRKCSKIIYFIHLYIWTILYMLIYGEKTYGLYMFVLTCIVSIGISVIVICVPKIKEKQT